MEGREEEEEEGATLAAGKRHLAMSTISSPVPGGIVLVLSEERNSRRSPNRSTAGAKSVEDRPISQIPGASSRGNHLSGSERGAENRTTLDGLAPGIAAARKKARAVRRRRRDELRRNRTERTPESGCQCPPRGQRLS
ncbi:hypothetical protein KM043_011619 [Ampulex compressa]|nr:hypothetical protein KM043_011619 [Ampulex compressa]